MKKQIRPATAQDLDFLYTELQQDLAEQHVLHRFQYSREEFKDLLFGKHPIAEALILLMDDTPAGFAIYGFDYRNFTVNRGLTLYLNDLYVKANFRRHGGATALLEQLQIIAKAKNCKRIEWLTQVENEIALNLYQKFQTINLSPILDYMRLPV